MARLHRHYHPLVRRVVQRVAWRRGRALDAEELCQETWCRLLTDDARLLRYFDPTRGSFDGFLARLARQQAGRAVLAERRHRQEQVDLGEDGIEQLVADSRVPEPPRLVLVLELRRHARRHLHPHDEALLVRCIVGGAPVGELAAELGVSRDALYKRSQRFPSKLRRLLERIGSASERSRDSSANRGAARFGLAA